jgi:hypothetical protein
LRAIATFYWERPWLQARQAVDQTEKDAASAISGLRVLGASRDIELGAHLLALANKVAKQDPTSNTNSPRCLLIWASRPERTARRQLSEIK